MLSQTENIYEKRLINRLKTYWERIRENEDIPLYSKFNSGGISDIWENCILIKVISNSKDKVYNIEQVGRQLTEALGKDLQGRYFMSFDGGGSGVLRKEFIQILNSSAEKREFLLSEGTFVNQKGKIVKYRDCVMPFKELKGEVKYLIVGISWRSFG